MIYGNSDQKARETLLFAIFVWCPWDSFEMASSNCDTSRSDSTCLSNCANDIPRASQTPIRQAEGPALFEFTTGMTASTLLKILVTNVPNVLNRHANLELILLNQSPNVITLTKTRSRHLASVRWGYPLVLRLKFAWFHCGQSCDNEDGSRLGSRTSDNLACTQVNDARARDLNDHKRWIKVGNQPFALTLEQR